MRAHVLCALGAMRQTCTTCMRHAYDSHITCALHALKRAQRAQTTCVDHTSRVCYTHTRTRRVRSITVCARALLCVLRAHIRDPRALTPYTGEHAHALDSKVRHLHILCVTHTLMCIHVNRSGRVQVMLHIRAYNMYEKHTPSTHLACVRRYAPGVHNVHALCVKPAYHVCVARIHVPSVHKQRASTTHLVCATCIHTYMTCTINNSVCVCTPVRATRTHT
jgi:hypothetical protein